MSNFNFGRALAIVVASTIAALTAMAGNFRVYIDDFAISPGETREVYVYLVNDHKISSAQCDIILPEGLYVVDEEDDENPEFPDIVAGDRVPRRWEVNASYPFLENHGQAYVRVMLVNQRNYYLDEGDSSDGAIYVMNVRASDDFVGPQDGLVFETVITSEENPDESVYLDDEPFTATSATSLSAILATGGDGVKYIVGDALAVADYSEVNGFAIVTDGDGKGHWLRVALDDAIMAEVSQYSGIKAATLVGELSDVSRNPLLTVSQLPEELATAPTFNIDAIDLVSSFTVDADAIVKFSGFYFVENGVPTLRAASHANSATGSKGQSLTLGLDWLDGDYEFETAMRYDITGVIQLKEAWSGAPRRARSSYDYDFQNYILNPLRPTDIVKQELPTGVTDVECDKPVVTVAGGNIEVVGATDVKIYSLDGRRVDGNVGGGAYIVIADGTATKVVVR